MPYALTKLFIRPSIAKAYRAAWLWDIAAFSIPFLLFLRTMAPTVYGLDSAELTSGAYVLGIVHAPGAPLYLLIGHVFTWLPFGDIGYRLNLLSACAASITAWFVFRILLHLTQHRFLSLMTSYYLACSYYFWISALFAELYALHACLMMGLLCLVLLWRKQHYIWQLYLLGFGFGLSMGNHLSMVLLGPGLAWLALSVSGIHIKRTHVLMAALCAFAGALIYLYLPWRAHSGTALNYARDYWNIDLATWSGFWWMVSGRMFGSLFFSVPPEKFVSEVLKYIYQLWSNFLGLGFIVGIVGLLSNFKKQPRLHIGLLLMFAGHLIFYLTYGAIDKELMFLPTFLIFGLWIGLGIDYLNQRLISRLPQLGSILLSAMLVMNVLFNFEYVDLSHDRSARLLGENILAAIEPNATYFGTWKDVPILEYLQVVEGRRLDIRPMQLFFINQEKVERIAYETLQNQHPVYISISYPFDKTHVREEYLEGCECYRLHLIDQ